MGQLFGVFQAEDSGRESMAEGVIFFAGKQSAQHQDASGDTHLAQHDTLIGRSHAEPFGARLLQRGGTFFHAVTISIALHHRADGDVRADMMLQHAKVVAQSGERNFGPVGAGFDARGCKSRSQVLMIMQDGAPPGKLVVPS